jgi:hypothetical protein
LMDITAIRREHRGSSHAPRRHYSRAFVRRRAN